MLFRWNYVFKSALINHSDSGQWSEPRDKKIWVMRPAGPETKHEYAGEDQQQFTRQTVFKGLSYLYP
jgi:hypothetical protein